MPDMILLSLLLKTYERGETDMKIIWNDIHEIGEYMNMKATTIRSKLSRALAKMGKYLEVI